MAVTGQSWLQLMVYDDVLIAVALKVVLVVVHHGVTAFTDFTLIQWVWLNSLLVTSLSWELSR